MNYYRRYPGSYLKKTSRLSLTDHGAYSVMLDYYYTEERPLPLEHEDIYTMVRALRPEDRKAVDKVLRLYFEKRDDGYHNDRADEEIGIAAPLIEAARENGKKGGRRKNPTGNPAGSGVDNPTGLGDGTQQATQRDVSENPSGIPSGQHPTAFSLYPTTGLPDNLQPTPSTQGQPPSPGVAHKPRSPRRDNGLDDSPRTAEIWSAYCEAYRERYGVDPVRNATVNGQLAQVVKQLGREEAPQVARFYVGHSQATYVRAKHAVNLLLRDCTGLRTEWATGTKVTETAARQQDRTAATGDVFKKLIAEAEAAEKAP